MFIIEKGIPRVPSAECLDTEVQNDQQDILDLDQILQKDRSNNGTNKILIVDDQQFNIDAIEIILEYGLNLKVRKFCECAYNGRQAVDAVMQNVKKNGGKFCSYNLILIDCNMPFMDGYQATTLIREFLFEMSLE